MPPEEDEDELEEEYSTDTAVNCKRDGHCLHEATDPEYWYCCKCGHYLKQA